MLNFLATFFKTVTLNEALEHNEKPKKPIKKQMIYRDELCKRNPKPTTTTKTKPKAMKMGYFDDPRESSEPMLINKGSSEERKGVMRVKIMMTKKEANRLLSRCKDGGVLEFRDVARELVELPMNRVVVCNPPSNTLLKTIPEE